ncbi:unnamed protein product, partial [Thlaspi arvense]
MSQTAKTCGSVDDRVCEDMISELPEDLLLRIFSFVPIKDAVAIIGLQTLLITAWMIFMLCWPVDPVNLPKSLYLCKSLVVFNLSHKIFVDVPSPAIFPSLKSLHLCYKDDDSVHDNVMTYCVKVPSLISFAYLKFQDDNDVGDNGNSCLVIDSPILKCFIFIDHLKEYCSMDNMPPLVSATISDYTYRDDKFLRPIFSVKTLEFFSDEILVCCSTITFSRFVNLRICPDESNWVEPYIHVNPRISHFHGTNRVLFRDASRHSSSYLSGGVMEEDKKIKIC